jgi:CO dehydrogenase/acetyl-CoA synthase beta subunit
MLQEEEAEEAEEEEEEEEEEEDLRREKTGQGFFKIKAMEMKGQGRLR